TFGYTLVVNAFAITDAALLPQGVAGSSYTHTFSAPACVSCVWSTTALPNGFTMSAAGVFTGTSTATSGVNTSFTVTATGSNGAVSKLFALVIAPTTVQGLSVTTAITTTTTAGATAATLLSSTGGTPPYAW